ncbi:MAG: hypothetical protein IJQ82_11615, partial [Selenomonadaceae bacterium]|nr:hypothetical protein [Selenomonadaceae bacterium]
NLNEIKQEYERIRALFATWTKNSYSSLTAQFGRRLVAKVERISTRRGRRSKIPCRKYEIISARIPQKLSGQCKKRIRDAIMANEIDARLNLCAKRFS